MISAVIFDLGRVIVDIDIRRLLSVVSAGVSADDVEGAIVRALSDEVMRDFNRGRIGPVEFYEAMMGRHDLDMGFEEFKDLWCGIFSPMAGMEELLRELDGKVKLGLLSDTDPLHWGYLRGAYPVLEIFARPTLSYEVGLTKPDEGIYLAASENVGVEPGACLYIDDLEANAAGAVAVGMEGVVFKGADSLRGELEERGVLNTKS